jgi:hypothetical protein
MNMGMMNQQFQGNAFQQNMGYPQQQQQPQMMKQEVC